MAEDVSWALNARFDGKRGSHRFVSTCRKNCLLSGGHLLFICLHGGGPFGGSSLWLFPHSRAQFE